MTEIRKIFEKHATNQKDPSRHQTTVESSSVEVPEEWTTSQILQHWYLTKQTSITRRLIKETKFYTYLFSVISPVGLSDVANFFSGYNLRLLTALGTLRSSIPQLDLIFALTGRSRR